MDWREDDSDIVAYCADVLGIDSLSAEWRDEDLFITYRDREVQVALACDAADRHTTICTLNDILSPEFEIRFLVFSHGSDTLGFAALPSADWREMEKANAQTVAENFIDPRKLPNLMTEFTDDHLPANAKTRFERMLERNRE